MSGAKIASSTAPWPQGCLLHWGLWMHELSSKTADMFPGLGLAPPWLVCWWTTVPSPVLAAKLAAFLLCCVASERLASRFTSSSPLTRSTSRVSNWASSWSGEKSGCGRCPLGPGGWPKRSEASGNFDRFISGSFEFCWDIFSTISCSCPWPCHWGHPWSQNFRASGLGIHGGV